MKATEILQFTNELTVLFVEDEKDAREMVTDGILSLLFKKVHCAQNGEEGLGIFEKERCDIIITDLKMPIMGGIEMIKKIREIDKEIPIIILSAHSDTDYFIESIELDIEGYILKPIKESSLHKALYKTAKNIADKKELEYRRRQELERKDIFIDYQKNKIQNYKTLLEELLIIKHFRQNKLDAPSSATGYTRSDALLNEEELEILRKKRSFKYTAQEYVSEIDSETLSGILLLSEIEKDLDEAIDDFREMPHGNKLKNVLKYLDELARNIKLLIEFQDIACALESYISFLENLSEEDVHTNAKKIALYSSNIAEDLKEWRNKIFVEQSTQDIHYLDSSLFSSTLQLQLELYGESGGDSGNDLELF